MGVKLGLFGCKREEVRGHKYCIMRIIRIAKTRRVYWAGYIACIAAMRNATKASRRIAEKKKTICKT
jgi:hypothetical protein